MVPFVLKCVSSQFYYTKESNKHCRLTRSSTLVQSLWFHNSYRFLSLTSNDLHTIEGKWKWGGISLWHCKVFLVSPNMDEIKPGLCHKKCEGWEQRALSHNSQAQLMLSSLNKENQTQNEEEENMDSYSFTFTPHPHPLSCKERIRLHYFKSWCSTHTSSLHWQALGENICQSSLQEFLLLHTTLYSGLWLLNRAESSIKWWKLLP